MTTENDSGGAPAKQAKTRGDTALHNRSLGDIARSAHLFVIGNGDSERNCTYTGGLAPPREPAIESLRRHSPEHFARVVFVTSVAARTDRSPGRAACRHAEFAGDVLLWRRRSARHRSGSRRGI